MAYAYDGEGANHSASHENAGDSGGGCPELALASAASVGDFNPVICPSIYLKVQDWHAGTSVFLPAFFESHFSSNPPLLFLLFSNLRN